MNHVFASFVAVLRNSVSKKPLTSTVAEYCKDYPTYVNTPYQQVHKLFRAISAAERFLQRFPEFGDERR